MFYPSVAHHHPGFRSSSPEPSLSNRSTKALVAPVFDTHSVHGGLTCHNSCGHTFLAALTTRLLSSFSLISFRMQVALLYLQLLHLITLVLF